MSQLFGVMIVSKDGLNGTVLKVNDGGQLSTERRETAQDIADYKNRHEGGYYRFVVFEYGDECNHGNATKHGELGWECDDCGEDLDTNER